MPLPSSGPPGDVGTHAGERRLRRLEQLSYYLDNAVRVPGINYRIGYDALIGLIPGAGDLLGLAISSYIVLEAARLRLPATTIARMAFNVAVEAVIGSIPLLGDVFDATWKANARNVALARRSVGEEPTRARRRDRRFFILIALGLAVLLLVLGAGVIYLLRALVSIF